MSPDKEICQYCGREVDIANAVVQLTDEIREGRRCEQVQETWYHKACWVLLKAALEGAETRSLRRHLMETMATAQGTSVEDVEQDLLEAQG